MAALSAKHYNLVKDVWEKQMVNELDHYGIEFFLAVFTRAPHVKYMFSFIQDNPTEADLRKNYFLQKHSLGALKFAGECMLSFGNAADTEVAFAKLRRLGQMHSKYAVVEAGFPVVKDSLIEVMKRNFGNQWTKEIETAYSVAIEICVKEMTAGLRAGYSRRHRRTGISL